MRTQGLKFNFSGNGFSVVITFWIDDHKSPELQKAGNNEEQCRWAWEYINKSKGREGNLPTYGLNPIG